MSAEAILTVSAAVVLLTQILKWSGVPTRLAPVVVLLVSAFGVGFWGWSMGTLGDRTLAFEFFAGWVSVSAAAAGVFGFVREAAAGVASMRKNGAVVALVLVSVLGVGAAGCATLRTAPGQASATEQARLGEIAALADAGGRVLLVVEQLQQLEIALHASQLVPDQAHLEIQRAFLTFAQESTAALQVAGDVTRSDADRRHAITGLITVGDHVLGVLELYVSPAVVPNLRSGMAAVHAALLALQLAV